MHEESKSGNCACHRLNRRELLQVIGGSAGALILTSALPGCSPATGSPPSGPISAMNVSDFKLNSMRVLSSNVVVGLDSKGPYAMSAICTHAGCVLEDNSETIAAGLYCPCHGSSFDGNGVVTHGPARSALQHYQVSVATDGSITVDGSKPVAADARTSVG